MKTASAWQAPKTNKASASAPVQKPKDAVTIDFSAPATSTPAAKPQPRQKLKQAKQVAPLKPMADSKANSFSSLVPLPVACWTEDWKSEIDLPTGLIGFATGVVASCFGCFGVGAEFGSGLSGLSFLMLGETECC